ncbi:MAG: hypothetical protein CSA21_05365 [Deltaproteobacteria bacterium]|nr:MAG: hypothetical protein CSA21_05365 [Deltaproteobacteria bacterium]
MITSTGSCQLTLDQQYLPGNEPDDFVENKGDTSTIFLCFCLLVIVDKENSLFYLSNLCVGLLTTNSLQKRFVPFDDSLGNYALIFISASEISLNVTAFTDCKINSRRVTFYHGETFFCFLLIPLNYR